MFTKEQLLTASALSKYMGNRYKGVLTRQEIAEKLKNAVGQKSISTITYTGKNGDSVMFFTDDHCFGHPVLPKCFVSSTTSFPISVKERPGIEDGWVDSPDKYILVFHQNDRLIETVDELVDFLNKHFP